MSQLINRKTNEVSDRNDSFISGTETEIYQDQDTHPYMFRNDNDMIWKYSKDKPRIFVAKEGVADCMRWAGVSEKEIEEGLKDYKP